MMPHVATDSARGVRSGPDPRVRRQRAARRALADLDAAAAALEPPGDDVAEIRAALDAHDDVARVAEALHDEWGYAALRLSADWTTSRRATSRPPSCPCWSASAPPAGPWSSATASCRTRPRRPRLEPYRHYLARRRAERAFRLDPLAEQAFAARGDAASTPGGASTTTR